MIIIGTAHSNYVQLDFDNMEFEEVKKICNSALKTFKLQGYLIIESSKNHYHVIFNKRLSYKNALQVLAWVSLEVNKIEVYRYIMQQLLKDETTLRLTKKRKKPIPKPIFVKGKQNGGIKWYLRHYVYVNFELKPLLLKNSLKF